MQGWFSVAPKAVATSAKTVKKNTEKRKETTSEEVISHPTTRYNISDEELQHIKEKCNNNEHCIKMTISVCRQETHCGKK